MERFCFLLVFVVLSPYMALAALSPAITTLPSTTVEVGEMVYFDATSSTYDDAQDLRRARFEWDFGDGYHHKFYPVDTYDAGIAKSGLAVTHFFMAPDTYTVTLKISIWEDYDSEGAPLRHSATSTTSVTTGTGSKTLTIETGLSYAADMLGKISSSGGQLKTGWTEFSTNVWMTDYNYSASWLTVDGGDSYTKVATKDDVDAPNEFAYDTQKIYMYSTVDPDTYSSPGVDIAIPSQWMKAKIISYDSGTGELVVDVSEKSGDWTHNNWTMIFQEAPVVTATTTQQVVVTGEAPMSNFEIQHAPFENRVSQYLYIQIPEAHRGGATQLKVSLIGDTEGTTVLLAPKNNLDAEEVLLFDQSALPADNYVVQAELLDSGNSRITGGLWRDKFSKAYSGMPEVGIDYNNAFRVNGNLFFPIMTYQADYADGNWTTDTTPDVDDFKYRAGVNVLHCEGYVASHDATTWAAYCDDAADLNMMTLGPGDGRNTDGAGYEVQYSFWPPAEKNRWKFNNDVDIMASIVGATKDKVSMFGWLWQDEPNMGGRSGKVYMPTLSAWWYRGQVADPQIPSYALLYGYDWCPYYDTQGLTDYYDYTASAQHFGGKKWTQPVFSFDNYPIQGKFHASMNYTDRGVYSAYLWSLDKIKTNSKGLIPIVPALQPCWGQSTFVLNGVSSDQVYMEAWMNVIYGARGILWFPKFYTNSIAWESMMTFKTQMDDYYEMILGDPPATTCSDNSDAALNRVETMVRKDGDTTYLFTVRVAEPDPVTAQSYIDAGLPVGTLSKYLGVEDNTITTTFTLSDTTINGAVEVVGESRTVTATNGVFQDTFGKPDVEGPSTVHIYRYPAQGASAAKATMGSGSSAVRFGNAELPAIVFGQ